MERVVRSLKGCDETVEGIAPKTSRGSDEEEQREILKRIANSAFFKLHKQARDVLEFLFEKRDTYVTETQIAIDGLHLIDAKQIDGGSGRQLCKTVRTLLEEYAASGLYDDLWSIFLPVQRANEGYKLKISSRLPCHGAAKAFWRAHLNPIRPLRLIYNEPLFFRDEESRIVIRIPEEPSETRAELLDRVRRGMNAALGEEVTGTIYPCHMYALSGEAEARERLASWFSKEVGLRTESIRSRTCVNTDPLGDWSNIILGNSRSNGLLREMSTWHQFGIFPYRVGLDTQRISTIHKPSDDERDFFFDKYDGEEDDRGDILLRDNLKPGEVVFAAITRLPNPYTSDNAITIMSSGYTKVLDELARMLTDENDMQGLIKQSRWSLEKPLPRYFQWLFSVRLGRNHPDDRPRRPKLRAVYHFNRSGEQPQRFLVQELT